MSDPAPAPGEPAPAAPPVPARAHLVLAEDEAPLRKVLLRVLATAGYDVVAAGSGTELLAIMDGRRASGEPHRPDLVITDVRLPDMDGRELVRRLGCDVHIPAVLFMSGAPVRDSEGAPEVFPGRSAFLDKPFDLVGFLDVVKGLLACPMPEAAAEGKGFPSHGSPDTPS